MHDDLHLGVRANYPCSNPDLPLRRWVVLVVLVAPLIIMGHLYRPEGRNTDEAVGAAVE